MGSQSWTWLSDLHFHFKICIHRLKVYIHRRRYSWWVYTGKLSQQYYPQFQPEGRGGKQDDYPKKRGRFSRLRHLGSIIQEGDRHANSPVPSGTYRHWGRGRVAICVVTSPTVHSDACSSLGIDAMTLARPHLALPWPPVLFIWFMPTLSQGWVQTSFPPGLANQYSTLGPPPAPGQARWPCAALALSRQ